MDTLDQLVARAALCRGNARRLYRLAADQRRLAGELEDIVARLRAELTDTPLEEDTNHGPIHA